MHIQIAIAQYSVSNNDNDESLINMFYIGLGYIAFDHGYHVGDLITHHINPTHL